MGVGEGLSEICFKEVPELFIIVLVTSGDSGVKEVQLVLLPWFHCVTSHVCESCSDAGIGIGHCFIVTIGSPEEVEGDEEARTL